MAKTQKNKATSFHLGRLKAQLAKLRRELLEPKGAGGGGPGDGFDVAKTGVARIGFIGAFALLRRDETNRSCARRVPFGRQVHAHDQAHGHAL